MGIYGVIQLSKVGPGYCQNMLVDSLYFRDSSHNTFNFPFGMLTPTLFDIDAIAGLRPTGEAFDPNEMNEDTINFEYNKDTFTHYMSEHHNTTTDEIFDEEHIAFLAL